MSTLSYGVEDRITCGIMKRSGIIYNERHSATESEVKLWRRSRNNLHLVMESKTE